MLLEDITKHPSYEKLVKSLAKTIAEQNLAESVSYFNENRDYYRAEGKRQIDYLYDEATAGIDEEMSKVTNDIRYWARIQYRAMVRKMSEGKI